ncbi:RidA family protein [Streptomyces sp. N2-109]|uniref:RidA family protein n=1 Tax=Streptomyces gossypii TaxID=2883101 RepID=A0ABT2JZV7_9ACTN|nr:RidA family protein [Streptomyces gossypii]MCT2593445.1 RidA family protein [Streptomyces gossypii]
MSDLTHVFAPEGVAPRNGYSHVVWGEGKFIAVSSQVPLDEHGKLVGEGDPYAQTAQVFENIRLCLAEAGATLEDIIKLTFFMTDFSILPAVREARDVVIDKDRGPASTALKVNGLVRDDILLQIEAFAVA